jgi:uncharacterized protein
MELSSFILNRRQTLLGLGLSFMPLTACSAEPGQKPVAKLQSTSKASKLIAAAREQIGVTLRYDPAYTALSYPNGDVPRELGVCTDVVIRAYRDAFGIDLQKSVHEDMAKNFAAYPKNWGLKRADRNIDHRRVPNLRTFMTRQGANRPVSQKAEDWQPGDILTSMVGGKLPHIGIVSDRSIDGRPLVIHNIGRGTQEEDILFTYPINGHYRWMLD